MKKILIGLGVVIVVIVAAVFVVPPLIDWKSFEPRIADAVRDATGRELHIDGDISVSIVPLEFSVSGIRLSNAPGMRSPEMVSVGSVQFFERLCEACQFYNMLTDQFADTSLIPSNFLRRGVGDYF